VLAEIIKINTSYLQLSIVKSFAIDLELAFGVNDLLKVFFRVDTMTVFNVNGWFCLAYEMYL